MRPPGSAFFSDPSRIYFDMALQLLVARLLLLSCTAVWPRASASSVAQRAGGVFLLIEGGSYTFNFSAASAACLSMNVTIATLAQVDKAVQQGLEMCKFGWILEKVAVIPRQTADLRCGSGKTGVVLWRASEEKKFGVFCFNASDFQEPLKASTPSPGTSTPSSSPAAATTPSLSITASPSTAENHQQATLTSTTRPPSTPGSSSTSTPQPSLASSTSFPPPSPLVFTFAPASLTQPHASNYPVFLESGPAKPPLGGVFAVVLGVFLLILASAIAAYFYRLKISSLWPARRQHDDAETEMWKHADSEVDLRGDVTPRFGQDRKSSGDVTPRLGADSRAPDGELRS